MSDLARFSITLNALGRGTIDVNEEDVSERVSGFEIQSRQGQPPLLVLHHIGAHGAITGEGIVQVVPGGQRNAIGSFLSNIDPSALEKEVLSRCGFADDTMQVVLEVLREWAAGD